MTKKELQSLLEARTKALKEAQERAENLKYENDLIKNNNTLILKQDRILRSTIKQMGLIAESNTYNNEKVALRKINELASTANQN
jgi:hypothetical protein